MLSTKLSMPSLRPRRVQRERLLTLLEAGRHRALTLISAPAGFGKSTLVCEWASSLNRPMAWLSLDKGDNDLRRFLTYLAAALETFAEGCTGALKDALQSPQLPSAESLLTPVVNALALSEEEGVLILDDTHVLEESAVEECLSFLAMHLPASVHLVLITRRDPPLPLARLRVRDQITEIRVSELSFDAVETVEFLNDVMGLSLTEMQVAALGERTEGWAAGLQLAALSMRGHRDIDRFVESFTGSHRFVLDYLLEEVLMTQPQPLQDFLLSTSILERFCGPLCDVVMQTAEGAGQEMLEVLEQANLFLIPLDHERRWYRYHHLFSDLLQQRLQSRPAPPDGWSKEALHERACRWFEQEGLELEAFQHSAATSNIQRTLQLLDSDGLPLHYRGESSAVLAWLSQLPQTTFDEHPALWVMYASVLSIAGKNSVVEETLDSADAALLESEDNEKNRDLRGQSLALRVLLYTATARYELLEGRSLKALELLSPDNHSMRALVTGILGVTLQMQGHRKQAMKHYKEAVVTSKATGNLFQTLLFMTGVAFLHFLDNRLRDSEAMYRQVIDLALHPRQSVLSEAWLGLAKIHYQWNELEKSEEYARIALPLGLQLENVDSDIGIELLLAQLLWKKGEQGEAKQLLDSVEEKIHQRGFFLLLPALLRTRIDVLLSENKTTEALLLAEENELAEGQARVLWKVGRTTEALDIIQIESQRLQQTELRDDWLRCKVLEALLLNANAHRQEAMSCLEDVLRETEASGHLRLYLDEGPAMHRLLQALVQEGQSTDTTARLLTFFRKEDLESSEESLSGVQRTLRGSAGGQQPLLEALSARELEVLQLIAEGLSNREIAKRLFVALDTVKGHNRRIYGKLQVKRRTEAVAAARDLGLL